MDIFTDKDKLEIFTERYCVSPNTRQLRVRIYDLIHDIANSNIKEFDIVFKDYPLIYLENMFATLMRRGSSDSWDDEGSPLNRNIPKERTAYTDTFTSIINELSKRLRRKDSKLQKVASEAMFKHTQKMLIDKEFTMVKHPFLEYLDEYDRVFLIQQLKMYFYCLFKFDLTDIMKRIISSVYDSYNWYDNKTSKFMSEYGDTMEDYFIALTEEYTEFRDFFVESLKEICERNRGMWERSTFFHHHAQACEILELLEMSGSRE